MLVDDVISDEIPSLCTNRLNQDCVENMFSIVRGKGGHRVNPSPREFRQAFRQVMVDRLLSVSEYSNYKDDVDHFLLNLTSSSTQQTPPPTTSEQIDTATISRCIDTSSLIDTVLYQQDVNVQEENIL